MTVATELMLDALRRWQPRLEQMERQVDAMVERAVAINVGLRAAGEQCRTMTEARAAQRRALETIGRQLDRIEQRLELTN